MVTMLFRPLVTLSLFSIALASPFRRAENLNVSVAGPSGAVSSIDDLKFIASVTNTGSEAVKILKYGTILDGKLPTRSFTVTKDGKGVAFTGVKMTITLEDEAVYTVIQPGETVAVEHEIAHLFDFATAGPGNYSFAPVTNFSVNENNAVAKMSVDSTAVEVEVTGDLAKRELPQLNKRAANICKTGSRKSFIDASYSEAKALARDASSYIASRGTGDSLYKAYYGTNTASKITSILNAIANEKSGSRTLSCIDSFGLCDDGVVAYTITSTTNIYYCSIFFEEVATSNLCNSTTVASRNVRGGTTLHEFTHALGDTDDITYGCSADQALPDSQKMANADNYNCFTTQVYANTVC